MAIDVRQKGHNFERRIARELRPIFGPQVGRGMQSFSGKNAPDVNGADGLWIECKVGARPNPKRALEQAEADTDGRTPIAICKWDRDKEGPIVVMRWSTWVDMIWRVEASNAENGTDGNTITAAVLDAISGEELDN